MGEARGVAVLAAGELDLLHVGRGVEAEGGGTGAGDGKLLGPGEPGPAATREELIAVRVLAVVPLPISRTTAPSIRARSSSVVAALAAARIAASSRGRKAAWSSDVAPRPCVTLTVRAPLPALIESATGEAGISVPTAISLPMVPVAAGRLAGKPAPLSSWIIDEAAFRVSIAFFGPLGAMTSPRWLSPVPSPAARSSR
ncbi:MAG: hypothetical protein R3C69_15735 [Geminicoccaceae bacterium]